MENFMLVAEQVAMLFVIIGAGALCRKFRIVGESGVRGMVNILLLVVTPALIVDCFQRPFDTALLRQLGLAFLLSAAIHLAAIALAHLTARGGDAARPVLRMATVFSNAGFMGIPLEQAILGSDGVLYGVAYVAVFNVFLWSWGLRTVKGADAGAGARGPNLKMFVNPGTVGLAIGLPLFLGSVGLPEIVRRPVHMLAELNTPLAMLVIGYYLAGADLRGLVRNGSVYATSVVRLVAFPVAVVAGFACFGDSIDRTMALALVTATSAPVAAVVTMMASKFRRDVALSVGLVSGTTIASIFTMPAVIALAMSLFR